MKQIKEMKKWLIIGVCLWISVFTIGCTSQTTHLNQNGVSQGTQQIAGTEARIHFIDTGNSDAILIQQGEVAALIDGGDNDDETLIVDYLKAQNVQELDYVIATHPDADHIGGLDAVITQLKVNQVLVGNGKATTKTYTDFIEAMMSKGLSPSVPLLYSEFPLGEAMLKIVSVANEKDPNNCSLVVLYTYGKHKVLFMGDADQSIEKTLDVNQIGQVDLIKVGHHGSKTSSNKAFLKAVSPNYAVITCGADNKYGHPNQETLQTLQELKITTYRTDQMGNIVFDLNDEEFFTPESKEGNQATNTINKDKMEQIQQDDKQSIVYFTAQGSKYHLDPNCSNMKNAIEGTLKTVGEREACKKCFSF